MTKKTNHWVPNRGLGRLLAQETNISDLIQLLSDRDRTPWADLVGFVPVEVLREAQRDNKADLLLSSPDQSAVVEVKLGHQMDTSQQKKYESLASAPDLFLAALNSDEGRVDVDADRWSFLSLSDLVARWKTSDDEFARILAAEAATALKSWDDAISGVFSARTSDTWRPLSTLNQKFLGRVVTRKIARDLRERGRLTGAGVTSGGGLPLVQAWAPIRGEGNDRTFIAEIRWWETKPGGELRFGVDFEPLSGQPEDEEMRRAAYDLARSMGDVIDYGPLKDFFAAERPELAGMLQRDRPSRPQAKGDWEQIVVHGFKDAPPVDGKKNNRTRTWPDFYGDGAVRFQAIAEIDFEQASAIDAMELIDVTLSYLTSQEP